ncbi:MAG TPA: DUF4140 domain-containing protein, partial [Tepidisphaeraceae bacterium]|nr:DUF4140 domain-containing protein [Tepidisphaeraceae bacterium]
MRMSRLVMSSAISSVAFIAFASSLALADPLVITGKLEEVTVYRGQALVTRTLDVSGSSGIAEIVVTDLPQQIQPASLYAEAPGGSKIRAVSFRTRAVSDDVRKEVRDLDDAIALVNLEIESLSEKLRVIEENAKSLESLQTFTASTSSSDLSKGTLNAETLERMAKFLFDQRAKFSDERLKANIALRDANSRLQLLSRKRNEITGS